MGDAGRVIAGTARGTRLRAPGEGTRPIGDRVKQTLFAILEPDLPGARVLDLFAGSGAAGVEALSRGAASATFVELDSVAVKVIGENLVQARLSDRGRVVRADVRAFLRDRVRSGGPYDIVVLDPPYADAEMMSAALAEVGSADDALLAPEAWVVAKHFWRTPPPAASGLLASVRNRRFGETALTFYRRAGTGPGGTEPVGDVGPDRPPAERQEAAR